MSINYKPKYKICVSGAAETEHCGTPQALELARQLGQEIIKQGAALVTGATSGVPYWAARGAKEEGGMSIGLSPAVSEKEHIKTYKLPTDYFDVIIYTGFDYAGRNLLLTRAADAVIVGCGRMGTLNEFTIAFEEKKPIGVLVGPWTTDDMIKEMVSQAHRGPGKIIYEEDPKKLVQETIKLIEKEKK